MKLLSKFDKAAIRDGDVTVTITLHEEDYAAIKTWCSSKFNSKLNLTIEEAIRYRANIWHELLRERDDIFSHMQIYREVINDNTHQCQQLIEKKIAALY